MPVRELPPSEVALIDAFADHLALERHLSPTTVAAYRRDLAQLATFLHRGRLDRSAPRPIRSAPVPRAAAHLGYARASIARRVGAIHTFYRWAVAPGRRRGPLALLGPAQGREPAADRAPRPRRPRRSPRRPPSPGTRPTRSSAVALRDRAVLELLYGSGLRVGEVAGLTLDRIDLDRGRVLVIGKGDKEREVPMSTTRATPSAPTCAAGRPTASPRRDELFYNRREARSAHAISVRWWNDMAVQCCRAGG